MAHARAGTTPFSRHLPARRAEAAPPRQQTPHPPAEPLHSTCPDHLRRRTGHGESRYRRHRPGGARCRRAPLPACGGAPDTASADTAGTAPAATDAGAPRYTLDERSLPPVNRFQASDLDTSVNACHDFNAHANGKWLAANEIPGDRTSWGSFEMLTERTLEAQRQLAEHAAANESATGVEKIVGDFWATGMDRESIDAQGIAPIQEVID